MQPGAIWRIDCDLQCREPLRNRRVHIMTAGARPRVAPGVRKVLLIDDDRDCLTVLSMALKGLPGVETSAVVSAEEALRHLESESPDLVLTDLQLPGRSGIEFIT